MDVPREVLLVPQQVAEEAASQERIADEAALEEFARQTREGEWAPPGAVLRGVLAETAVRGLVRYDWALLQPLVHATLDAVLADFAEELAGEVGPPRPLPGGEGLDAVAARLHALLSAFDAPPFTYQRLCEVLLEPRKQYARIDKLVGAVEKLLSVTSTVGREAKPPPRPLLGELTGVNDNPPVSHHPGGSPTSVAPAGTPAQGWPLLNGQAGGGGGGGGPRGQQGSMEAFTFFMHAEIVTPNGPAASPPSPAPPPDPTEVANAEAFVAAALADASGPASPSRSPTVRGPLSTPADAAAQQPPAAPGASSMQEAAGPGDGSPQAAGSPPAAGAARDDASPAPDAATASAVQQPQEEEEAHNQAEPMVT